jgi:hypothetical protein
MAEGWSRVRQVVFVFVGVALLAGGGYGVVTGSNSVDTCGGSTLEANDRTEPSGAVVPFENLTETQQEFARRAIDGESPAVTADDWPWFEEPLVVRYQNTDYEVYTVTTECPFAPGTVLVVASLSALLGLATLVLTARRTVQSPR